MGKIIIERWKNSIATSKAFGKYFGRFKPNGTLDTRQVAQHIQEHGSIYTLPVILGVLAQAEQCIPELLLMGYKLKLEGLGTFKIHAQSKVEENTEDWNVAKDIKKLKVRFLPDQAAYSQMTSAAVTRSSQVGDMFEVLPYIVELRNKEKSEQKKTSEIETCFNALYGTMMLKLQKKEISPDTQHAIKEISTLLGMLSDYYKKDKNGELKFE